MNSELEDKCLIENDIAEIIDSFNAIEPDTYQTKRTIDEVLDKETGDIIKSEDFFKKNESELIQYRRRLAEAIAGYKLPKFVCAYCGQLLKLSGKQTRRGQVSFFAHLHDSDDCEIKTNGEFTKEEIEIRKYSNIRESQRHIDLKNEIANALESTRSKEIGIKDVEIEKRITSNVPYLYWKQPDIFAQFNDKSIVFELQLSTTFLSAIIDRDIFYRLNNTFIVWIFNFSDNQEYVNLSNLMCKDIYYSNKRNAFVFDNKARELSKKDGELVLLCIWFEPFVENGIFNPEKSVKKEAYIRMSDLKFDDEIFKPYFVDADSMFFKYQPDLSSNRINIEQLITIRLKKTEKHRLEREYLQNKKNEKISELKEQIKNGIAELTPFAKKEKYGFECNGVTIIEPIYSEVTTNLEYGYFKVKKGRKYGLIDFQGKEILSCNYKELIFLFENKCIVNEKNEWFCIDVKSKNKDLIYKPQIRDSILTIERISIVAYVIRIDAICGIILNNNKFCEYDIINDFIDGRAKAKKNYRWGIIDDHANTIIPFEYDYIEKNVDGKFHVKKNKFQGIYDENGNIIVNCKYMEIVDLKNFKYKVKGEYYWGVIDTNDNTVIPFEYKSLGDFINGVSKAKKYFYWGYIDVNGNTVIPFEYNDLGDFINGIAKANKKDYWGYIDVNGNTVISFEYKDLGDFIDGKAIARKNGKSGLIDEKGNVVIEFKYVSIEKFVGGRAKAIKNGHYGIIDLCGNEIIENTIELESGLIKGTKFGTWGVQSKDDKTIIPFEFDEIGQFINGIAKAKKNYKWGYLDEIGNIIIPLEFDQIEEFYNGKAKAMKNLKWGFINESGDVIIPFEFKQIAMFNNSIAKATKNFKWGCINENGDEIIPFEFDQIEEFNNGKAKVIKNGMYGLIYENGYGFVLFREDKSFKGRYGERIENFKYGIKNINNEIIKAAIYDSIEEFVGDRAKAKKNKKYNGLNNYSYDVGYIDIYGNELIENTTEMESGLIKGQKFGKYGVISKENKIIVPFEYQSINNFINGKAKAKKNDKWGYINSQGKEIVPFEFTEIGNFVNSRAKAKIGFSSNQKYGYINENGEIVIPFIYDEIGDFIDGIAISQKRGLTIKIDEHGNEIDTNLYEINSIVKGRISNIVEYGLFILFDNNKTGLLHISELKKYNKTCSQYKLDNVIEVKIINIDKEKNRISFTLIC